MGGEACATGHTQGTGTGPGRAAGSRAGRERALCVGGAEGRGPGGAWGLAPTTHEHVKHVGLKENETRRSGPTLAIGEPCAVHVVRSTPAVHRNAVWRAVARSRRTHRGTA